MLALADAIALLAGVQPAGGFTTRGLDPGSSRHDLRTADALQLAAAFFVAEARPSTLEFVSLDDRLLAAGRREGFVVMRPTH